MARKRSLEQTHRGFHTGAVPSTSTPIACPVCGETPVVAKGEKPHQVLEAHIMAQHRPDATCQREHRSDAEATWRLDFDAVLHHTPALWFCSECGFYLQAD
jgi:hypothetical protein